MRKLVIMAALAASIGVGLATAPIASAFPATCDGEVVSVHFNGANQAFVPLHIDGTTSVLVPLRVVINGEVIADQTAGLEQSAVQLTTCTFNRRDGQGNRLLFEITGVLTPARP